MSGEWSDGVERREKSGDVWLQGTTSVKGCQKRASRTAERVRL